MFTGIGDLVGNVRFEAQLVRSLLVETTYEDCWTTLARCC